MSTMGKLRKGGICMAGGIADAAVELGYCGCRGVRVAGKGIRKTGEAIELAGMKGSRSCLRTRIRIYDRIETLCREIDEREAQNAQYDPEPECDPDPDMGPQIITV